MAEQLRRLLIRWLGGVIREPVCVEVAPAALLDAIRLADGLLSSGNPKAAQSQLRIALIRYRTENRHV